MALPSSEERTILSLASGATTEVKIKDQVKKWRDGTAKDLQNFKQSPNYAVCPWLAIELEKTVAACDSALARCDDIVKDLIDRGYLIMESGKFKVVSPVTKNKRIEFFKDYVYSELRFVGAGPG